MSTFVIVISLCLVSSSLAAVNPGFRTTITGKGLDYGEHFGILQPQSQSWETRFRERTDMHTITYIVLLASPIPFHRTDCFQYRHVEKSSKWNGAGPPDYTEGYGAMFDGINTNVCVWIIKRVRNSQSSCQELNPRPSWYNHTVQLILTRGSQSSERCTTIMVWLTRRHGMRPHTCNVPNL